MHGHSAAIQKRPPHGSDATTPYKVHTDAIDTGASITVPVVGSESLPYGGGFVTFRPTVDCYARWGDSTVADATSSDWEISANEVVEFWHAERIDTHVSVLAKTTAGSIKRYRSNT